MRHTRKQYLSNVYAFGIILALYEITMTKQTLGEVFTAQTTRMLADYLLLDAINAQLATATSVVDVANDFTESELAWFRTFRNA